MYSSRSQLCFVYVSYINRRQSPTRFRSITNFNQVIYNLFTDDLLRATKNCNYSIESNQQKIITLKIDDWLSCLYNWPSILLYILFVVYLIYLYQSSCNIQVTIYTYVYITRSMTYCNTDIYGYVDYQFTKWLRACVSVL